MPPSDGWYLLGPFIAVALVTLLGAVLWRMGPSWTRARDDPLRELYEGLAIFREAEDYGLLCPAAATDGLPHRTFRRTTAMCRPRSSSWPTDSSSWD